MNGIEWGVVFGVCSLLLLQAGFAVGACFLFFAVKSQFERSKDAYHNHLRETDHLKRTSEALTKKLDLYKQKVEDLKSVKIDGWEESDKELLSKIRSNTARISQLHKMLKEQYDEEEPLPDYQGIHPAAPVATGNNTNGQSLPGDFGKTVGL